MNTQHMPEVPCLQCNLLTPTWNTGCIHCKEHLKAVRTRPTETKAMTTSHSG